MLVHVIHVSTSALEVSETDEEAVLEDRPRMGRLSEERTRSGWCLNLKEVAR